MVRVAEELVGEPCSTTRPSCITSDRSVSVSITAKSWLTTTAATSRSASSPRSRSSTPAATDASRPVVGSSSSSTSGSVARALAICTRCRIPPENVRTGSSMRDSGTSTRSRSSAARARIAP
ncbi:hypothetical protein BJF90_40530 [Pseudonocardia sp. CNS-004]|nr:hypothetical protein BJF90_40530 [Pseudonocardia sp. CNS-004]